MNDNYNFLKSCSKPMLLILMALVLQGCYRNTIFRENVEDGIIYISDSINNDVPYLPRLCDSIDLVSLKINTGDCQLHVEVEGKGTPIVLINGGPGGTHHYFHPWFSRLRSSNKVIYYDQRGTGQSDYIPGEGYSFKQAIDDLEALRVALGIDSWVVFGYSYGGGLAQFYALKHPENVKGLVLMNTLPVLPDTKFESKQDMYFSDQERTRKNEIIRAYLNGDLTMNAFLYNLSVNGDWKRQHYLKPTHNEMVRHALYEWVHDQDFNSIMSESVGIYDFRGLFDYCPIPTLIFEGEKDLTWGDEKSKVIRENFPKAEFHRVLKAGHPIFSEAPDYFFSVMESFVSQLDDIHKGRYLRWKEQLPPLKK